MRTALALLLVLTVAAPRLAAGQSFEGTVRQRIVVLGPDGIAGVLGAGLAGEVRPDAEALFAAAEDKLLASATATTESSMFFKGKRVRMEMPTTQLSSDLPSELAEMMKGAYTLFDSDAKEMITVVPALGRAMVTTPDALSQLTGRADSVATLKRPSDPTTREIGAATLGGVETAAYEVVAGETIGRVWVAPSLRPVAEALRKLTGTMMAMFGGAMPGGLDRADGPYGKGFPVRTETLMRLPPRDALDPGGWSFFWSETTVDRSSLPDSLFAIPDGITVVRMGGD